jgi:hypothetical protein
VLRRVERVLFSRSAGALAAAVSALIFLGCMSISIGCRTSEEAKACAEDGNVLTQEGKIPISPSVAVEQTIFYPVAYASPPNLELHDPLGVYHVVEQKETCFRVRLANTGAWCSGAPATWKARGVRCPPPAPPASTPPAENAPLPALLPPTPIPAAGEGSGAE